MTATIERAQKIATPKPTKAVEREPANPLLRFHEDAAFDKPSDRDNFYAKAFAFEKRCADTVAWANERMKKIAGEPLRAFLAARDALRAEWAARTADHVCELVALGWEIRSIRLTLRRAHQKAIDAKRAAYEKLIADEMESWRASGAHRSCPSWGIEPAAADQQLRAKVEHQEWIAAGKGDLRAAEAALRVWESTLEILPTFNSYTITWPEFAPDVAEIASMVGLERRTVPERHELSTRARRVLRDLNLDDRPLLPAHVATVKALDAMAVDCYHPLSTVTKKQLPEVRALVDQLPHTREVRRYLADTAKGLPVWVL